MLGPHFLERVRRQYWLCTWCVLVHCHYHFRLNGSRLDVSNHAYILKMVEDGLVHWDVLPEDDQKHVASITMTAEYVPKDKGQNEVVVTIETRKRDRS